MNAAAAVERTCCTVIMNHKTITAVYSIQSKIVFSWCLCFLKFVLRRTYESASAIYDVTMAFSFLKTSNQQEEEWSVCEAIESNQVRAKTCMVPLDQRGRRLVQ